MGKEKDKDVIDFGEWLKDIRESNNYSTYQLAEEMKVEEKIIRKWERDLEFPNLDEVYRLSEIYQIPSEEIVEIKNKTLHSGVNGINKRIIRWISFALGISIYGTIWFCRIVLFLAFIFAWVFFYIKTRIY